MQKSIRHQSHAYQSEAEQLLSFFSLVSLFIMFAPLLSLSLSLPFGLSQRDWSLKLFPPTHFSSGFQPDIRFTLRIKSAHTHMLSPTHACTCNTYVRRNIKVRYCVIEIVSSYAGDAEHGLILAIIVFDNRRCPFELYWDAMLFLVRPTVLWHACESVFHHFSVSSC